MPASVAELGRIGLHQGAERARARPEGDEHGGKAAHEQQRGQDRLAPHLRLGFRVGEALERRTGQIHQIGRNQRQDAGRQKAQESRDQRGRDRDIG